MWQCKHTFPTLQNFSAKQRKTTLMRVQTFTVSLFFLTNFTVSLCIPSFPTHVKVLPSVLAVTSAALNTTNPRVPGFESPGAPIFCAFSTLHFLDILCFSQCNALKKCSFILAPGVNLYQSRGTFSMTIWSLI